MSATEVRDLPTGCDALVPSLDVGNLTRCGLPLTGEDAQTRGWLERALITAVMRRQVASADWGLRISACQAMGEVLIRWHETNRSKQVLADSRDFLAAMLPELIEDRPAAVEGAESSPATVAEEFRELTGLDVVQIARVFGVSRATVHQWMHRNPRGSRLQHLLRVTSLVREAAESRNIQQLEIWLQTPVEANGVTPMDLLVVGDFEAFIGFVHRTPIEQRLMRKSAFGPRRVPYRRIGRPIESITTSSRLEEEP